jgi:LPS-assembly lipoprotein
MWWRELSRLWRRRARLVAVLAAAALTAGCFEPLYGTHPALNAEGVQDKFAATEIPPIVTPKGTPVERVGVAMYNALEFNLHNGAGRANAPVYRLVVNVATTQFTAVVNPTSGRPDAQIDIVAANFQLIEMATGKVVVSDSTSAHVDYDIPGSQQRFAGQRAQRDAEDRAIVVAADAIRNRLASYFVAGT